MCIVLVKHSYLLSQGGLVEYLTFVSGGEEFREGIKEDKEVRDRTNQIKS